MIMGKDSKSVAMRRRFFVVAAATAAAQVGVDVASADSTTPVWVGAGATSNWSDTGNWLNGQVPNTSSGSIITFAGSNNPNPVNDLTNNNNSDQFYQILFNAGSGSFNLTGSGVKIYNYNYKPKIENNSGVLQTVSFVANGYGGILLESSTPTEFDPTAGDLTINSSIFADYNSGQISVYGNNNHVLTLNGAIGQYHTTASLYVGQNSQVVLNASNSYTGGTTLAAGTLYVDNTTGSGTGTGAVVVNSTATVGGTGNISGGVTINAGGLVTAGPSNTSTGTLHTGVQSWNSSGGYVAKYDGANADILNMSGLTINATAAQPFNVTATAVGGPQTLPLNATLTLATDRNTSSGTPTADPFAAALAINALNLSSGSTVSAPAGYVLALSSAPDGTGYDLELSDVAAAPEPTSLAMLALAASPMLGRRSRRTSRAHYRRF